MGDKVTIASGTATLNSGATVPVSTAMGGQSITFGTNPAMTFNWLDDYGFYVSPPSVHPQFRLTTVCEQRAIDQCIRWSYKIEYVCTECGHHELINSGQITP
jgi:hypothetical protein